MATRRYGLSAGENLEAVTEAVGAAVASDTVELTVDLATTTVKEGSTTRAILKEEVLLVLNLLEQYITRSNWPPA